MHAATPRCALHAVTGIWRTAGAAAFDRGTAFKIEKLYTYRSHTLKGANSLDDSLDSCKNLSTWQVFLLDKRMLDPRRPIGPPSKDDQLEQLIPYQQTLIMSPLLYATHSKQVAQLSGVPICSCALQSVTQTLMVQCLIVHLDSSTDWSAQGNVFVHRCPCQV